MSFSSSEPPYVMFNWRFAGIALIVIGAALIVGWVLVLVKHGRNVLDNNPRLGYCVCDISLLSVGCIITGIGLVGGQLWAQPLLLVAVGAAAFDLTHTLIYCAQISWPQPLGRPLPTWIYSVLILLILAVLFAIGWSDIDNIKGLHGIPTWVFWVSMVLGLGTGVAIAWATAVVRRRSAMISSGLPVR